MQHNINEGANTTHDKSEPDFFVNIGFKVDGELKYISSTALQAAFKCDELKHASFEYVIKYLTEVSHGRT